MSARTCLVSFSDPVGVRHSVEVTADSVYEAAALGIDLLKKDEWIQGVALGTPIEVRVSEPATTHSVSLGQIKQWVNGVARSPDEVLKKEKVKALII